MLHLAATANLTALRDLIVTVGAGYLSSAATHDGAAEFGAATGNTFAAILVLSTLGIRKPETI